MLGCFADPCDGIERSRMTLLPTRRWTCIFVGLLFATPLGAQLREVPPRADNQLRPEVSLTVPVRSALNVQLSGQIHVGQHASRVVQTRAGVTVQLRASDRLTLATGYQQLNGRPGAGPTVREHRPTLAATLDLPLPGGVTLSDRNQVERRFRGATRSTRYRNRITIEREVGSGSGAARLFLSDEVYFDSRYQRFVRNQIMIGAARRFARAVTAELYLMRQNDGRARPGDLFVLGTVLRLRR